jgi:hypothetical protein
MNLPLRPAVHLLADAGDLPQRADSIAEGLANLGNGPAAHFFFPFFAGAFFAGPQAP